MVRVPYLFVPARTEWGDSVGDSSGGRIRFLFGISFGPLASISLVIDGFTSFSSDLVVFDGREFEFANISFEERYH